MTAMTTPPVKPVIPPGRFCRISGGFADNAKQEPKHQTPHYAKYQAKHKTPRITRRVRKTVLVSYRDFIMRLSDQGYSAGLIAQELAAAHGVVRGRKAIWSFIESERQMQIPPSCDGAQI